MNAIFETLRNPTNRKEIANRIAERMPFQGVFGFFKGATTSRIAAEEVGVEQIPAEISKACITGGARFCETELGYFLSSPATIDSLYALRAAIRKSGATLSGRQLFFIVDWMSKNFTDAGISQRFWGTVFYPAHAVTKGPLTAFRSVTTDYFFQVRSFVNLLGEAPDKTTFDWLIAKSWRESSFALDKNWQPNRSKSFSGAQKLQLVNLLKKKFPSFNP